jgi:formiminotetrahydrofolate cyclodeaminase
VDVRELAELISSPEAVPGSGWVAGVTGAFAASLVAKAAARSEGWSGAGGARSQAADLRDRLLELSTKNALVYESALDALEQPGSDLAGALGEAADVPLALAEASADVALLAASAAECADGSSRPDAAAAAALAAGAARAAAKLISVNLATMPGDERLAAAQRAVEAADHAARAAFVSEI